MLIIVCGLARQSQKRLGQCSSRREGTIIAQGETLGECLGGISAPAGRCEKQTGEKQLSIHPYGAESPWAILPRVPLRFTLGYFRRLPTGATLSQCFHDCY